MNLNKLAKIHGLPEVLVKPSKDFARQRGMVVKDEKQLTNLCFMCSTGGSLSNQLIPRWISKKTLVSICSACYERYVGLERVDTKKADTKKLGISEEDLLWMSAFGSFAKFDHEKRHAVPLRASA